jgi:hypothetical protein
MGSDKKVEFLNLVRNIVNNDFAEEAAKNCAFLHSVLGLNTEVAELMLAKSECKDKLYMSQEIGDTVFYLFVGLDTMPGSLLDNLEQTELSRELRKKYDIYDSMEALIFSVGELTDLLKKQLAYAQCPKVSNLKAWYANIWYFLHKLAKLEDLTMGECIEVTTKKLNCRYPTGKFRYEDRENRDREKEKKAMEDYPGPEEKEWMDASLAAPVKEQEKLEGVFCKGELCGWRHEVWSLTRRMLRSVPYGDWFEDLKAWTDVIRRQAEHIQMLQRADDSSTKVIGRMEEEIRDYKIALTANKPANAAYEKENARLKLEIKDLKAKLCN